MRSGNNFALPLPVVELPKSSGLGVFDRIPRDGRDEVMRKMKACWDQGEQERGE